MNRPHVLYSLVFLVSLVTTAVPCSVCTGLSDGPEAKWTTREIRTDAVGGLHSSRSQGHSHNDYYRKRPLDEALGANMLSIEADVFVRDGELLVAHDPHEIRTNKTLRSMYLDPLMKAFRSFGGTDPKHPFGGRVRKTGQPLVLMVDFKSEGESTWKALEAQLKEYPGLVRVVTKQADGTSRITPGPVIVVVSGNRPERTITQAKIRRSAIDGRYPKDADSDRPPHLMPMISTSYSAFKKHADQSAAGSVEQAAELFARTAKKQGRLARIWATPDNAETWQKLANTRMQLINTDQPKNLGQFFHLSQAGVDEESSP